MSIIKARNVDILVDPSQSSRSGVNVIVILLVREMVKCWLVLSIDAFFFACLDSAHLQVSAL